MSRKIAQRQNLVLFGSAVVILAAILHAYQLFLELRIIDAAPHADPFLARLQIFLLLVFLVIAAGLAIGRRAGPFCSALGLVFVFLGHLAWLLDSHKMLRVMNQDGLYDRHPELIPPNIWGFIGARWWDPVLLILFVAFFVWEIKLLLTRAEKGHRDEGEAKPLAG